MVLQSNLCISFVTILLQYTAIKYINEKLLNMLRSSVRRVS